VSHHLCLCNLPRRGIREADVTHPFNALIVSSIGVKRSQLCR
jgi:hypothetical protein